MDVMFDLPSREDVVEVKVTESCITNGTQPLLEISPHQTEEGSVRTSEHLRPASVQRAHNRMTHPHGRRTSDLPVLPLRDVVIFPYVVMPLLVGRPASLARDRCGAGRGQADPARRPARRRERRSRPPPICIASASSGACVQVVATPKRHDARSRRRSRPRAGHALHPGRDTFCARPPSPIPFEGPGPADVAETEALAPPRSRCSRSTSRSTGAFRAKSSRSFRAPTPPSVRRTASRRTSPCAFELRQTLLEADTLRGAARDARRDAVGRDRAASSRAQDRRRRARLAVPESARVLPPGAAQGDPPRARRGRRRRLRRARGAGRSKQAARRRCKTRALRELRKLRRMSPMSPEFTVARNFVDWIVALPWTERTDDVLDVAHARAILDEDHYGLDEVKDRILDFIARAVAGRTARRTDSLSRRTAGRRQDVARPIDRARARTQVRAHVARRRARRGGDPRPSPHVHRLDAGPNHPGDATRRSRESGDSARRGRQARAGLPRRSGGGAARGARSRAEHARSTITTSRSTTTSRRCCSSRRRTLWREFPSRCAIAWRSSARRLSRSREARDRAPVSCCRGRSRRTASKTEDVVLEPDVLTAIMRGYTREAGVRELERRIARVARKLARRRAEVASEQGQIQTVARRRSQGAARHAAVRSGRHVAR